METSNISDRKALRFFHDTLTAPEFKRTVLDASTFKRETIDGVEVFSVNVESRATNSDAKLMFVADDLVSHMEGYRRCPDPTFLVAGNDGVVAEYNVWSGQVRRWAGVEA